MFSSFQPVTKSAVQNTTGQGNRSGGGTRMAKPAVVAGTDGHADRHARPAVSQGDTVVSSFQSFRETSLEKETSTDGMSSIRARYESEGFSAAATNFIMSSWRKKTQEAYDVFIKKWEVFAVQNKMDKISPHVSDGVEFLNHLIDEGYSNSAVATARSALSCYLILWENEKRVTFGTHDAVKRFMKGLFEEKPVLPRYVCTWDVNIVLEMLKSWAPVHKLTLKELTFKLCMLLALLSGQRCQTLHILSLKHMILTDKKCIFYIMSLIKQSRKGSHQKPIELDAFSKCTDLCVVTVLKEYLRRTKTFRKHSENQLFLILNEPHTPASKDTVARWIKTTLAMAGVNLHYSAHSTRMAATSAADKCGVPIETIMEAAGWSNTSTFGKFYKKEVEKQSMGQTLLDNFLEVQNK